VTVLRTCVMPALPMQPFSPRWCQPKIPSPCRPSWYLLGCAQDRSSTQVLCLLTNAAPLPLFLPSCQGAMRGNMFTHHQKTVIVDAPLHQDLHMQSEHGQQRPTSAPAMRNSPSMGRPGSHMLQRAGSRMWGNRWGCVRDGTAGICGGPSPCVDLLPRVLRDASARVSIITVW
jgi:hypothetical protein